MKDITGLRRGKLLVVEYSHSIPKRGTYWKCKCDCGNTKIFSRSHLVNKEKNKIKHYSSCGNCKTEKKHFNYKGFEDISLDYFTRLKNSAKDRNLEFNINIEYLWNLFILQDKKCALTGIDIQFNKKYKNKKEKTASLDRIDCSLGYIEGNLRWVHKAINLFRKNYPDPIFIAICNLVANKNNQTLDDSLEIFNNSKKYYCSGFAKFE